jgi:thiol-disulfide isomerase/thioredoxin
MHRACVGIFLVISIIAVGCKHDAATPMASAAESTAPTPPIAPSPVVSAAPTPNPSSESATLTADAAVEQVKLGPVHKLVVRDLEGNDVALSKFAGRPMIIEIWASWCGPCRVNRANVHALKGTMPERVAVIGVSVDTGAGLVKNFLKSNAANEAEFMSTPDFMDFIRRINASSSIPKTLYVDSKGRVVDLAEGTQSVKWLAAMAKNLK